MNVKIHSARFAAIKLLALTLALGVSSAHAANNLILFIPDGLRAAIVDQDIAPTMAHLRDEGVNFVNSHSVFPTFTTANASAFATGHHLGDTGDFSNAIYVGFGVNAANGTATPFLENDPVLREVNDHFNHNYLGEQSIIAAARALDPSTGKPRYATALIGKLGPAAIFDVTSLKGDGTLIIDDTTGQAGKEVPIPPEWKAAFEKYKIARIAPSRGDNGNFGDALTPGTWMPGLAQQQYFLETTIKVALPHFKEIGQPFVLVFWSRDPDGTQHNQGDSFHSPSPGINGPTSLSAVRNADTALATIEQALKALDLYDTTNIVVAADHGFSTIAKKSSTSPSTRPDTPYPPKEVHAGDLPYGFLAIDLFEALRSDTRLQLFDPDSGNKALDWRAGQHPARGNGVIGSDPLNPRVVVVSNGGSDLVYLGDKLSQKDTRELGQRIVAALLEQDYVSGIFVDDERIGPTPGALSFRDINLTGSANTPHPAIVVSFASTIAEPCGHKDHPELCAAMIADTNLQPGQGMHGSFSRSDTWNFMAARGPDFRKQFKDTAPASNADIGMTLMHLLGLNIPSKGKLTGRVLAEALSASSPNTPPLPQVTQNPPTVSKPGGKQKLQTTLRMQSIGNHVYLDAAGFKGRTVGLE